MIAWVPVGAVPPKALTEARLQLHWAAQIVAASTAAHVPARPDDSQTALSLLDREPSLASVTLDTDPPRRIALSLPDLRIVLLIEQDDELDEADALPLDGRTIADGLEWLQTRLGGAALSLPTYEMPSHPVARGRAFRLDEPEAFVELAVWFRNASRVFRKMDAGVDRCWPHHFDLAVLMTPGDDSDRSIGLGLSPGDATYDEPYWYVSPWPYPPDSDLPTLTVGHWHREGFVAAILTGTSMAMPNDPDRQHRLVDTFLESAISASRELLGWDTPKP